MSQAVWSKVKNFKITENWGEPERMNDKLILELDSFRDQLGTEIYVSCGTQGVHEANSEHYKGNAVDLIFPEVELKDLPDVLFEALRFQFAGLGIYTFWTYKGHQKGGLHLDVRTSARRALWLCFLDPKPKYVSLNLQNLKLHF